MLKNNLGAVHSIGDILNIIFFFEQLGLKLDGTVGNMAISMAVSANQPFGTSMSRDEFVKAHADHYNADEMDRWWNSYSKWFDALGALSKEMQWDSWQNYQKVRVDGNEYAIVGTRLYSKHAVDRMQPSGNRFPSGHYLEQAGGDYGRSVTPMYVEYVIQSSTPVYQPSSGNYIYKSGSVEVVLNSRGSVVTIMTK